MNKYYLVKSHDEITWQVMLSQSDNAKEWTDWTMCYCESKKDAEDIIEALQFCEQMSVMYERQEAHMRNEVV